MRVGIADCETDGLLPEMTRMWCLGVFDLSTRRYTNYSDVPESGSPPLEEGFDHLRSFDRIVFHNGVGFDLFAINRTTKGAPLDRRKVFDTMVGSRLADPEARGHSLEVIGQALGFPKGDHTDFSKWSPEMESYMRQDIRITYVKYEELAKRLEGWGRSVEIEHETAYLIALQMQNGFGFNVPEAQKLLAELLAERAVAEEKLKAVFPPILVADDLFIPKKDDKKRGYSKDCPMTKIVLEEFNASSRQQIAKRLIRKYGWKPTVYTQGGSPEVSEETLKGLDYPEAPIACEYLRLDKMISMLDAEPKSNGSGGGWLKHEKAGRIYGYVNTNGAVTGRMTHSRPNVAQADKDHRMRALWIPRPGWFLVGCDAEGIELRIMAHYLARYDGGAFARAVVEGKKEDGTDAHSINQRIAKLYSRNSPGAKTLIYAMIYGAGDPKLGTIILEDAQAAGTYPHPDYVALKPTRRSSANATLEWKKRMGRTVREAIQTGIVGYGDLVDAVKFKAKSQGYLVGLDGRRIYTRSEHSALNTLFQGGGAIIMKRALGLFHEWALGEGFGYEWDFAYCANVHDEVQMEVRNAEHAPILGKGFADAITKAGVDLGVRCPLAGSFAVGANWAETH